MIPFKETLEMSILDKKYYHQMSMQVAPESPNHLIPKWFLDQALANYKSSTQYNILEAEDELQAGIPALLTAEGDYYFPEIIEEGDWFEVYATTDRCRIVAGDKIIRPVGEGNNLLLNSGFTVRLVALSESELNFTFISNAGSRDAVDGGGGGGGNDGNAGGGGGSTNWTVLNGPTEVLSAGKSYLLNVTGDYLLSDAFEAGQQVRVHCVGPSVRIMANGNEIVRIGAGNNLLLNSGDTVTFVCISPNRVDILSNDIAYAPIGGGVIPPPDTGTGGGTVSSGVGEYGVGVYGNVPLGGYPLTRSSSTSGTLIRVFVETDASVELSLALNDTAVWTGTVNGVLEEVVNIELSQRDSLTLDVLSGVATQLWFQVDGVLLP